MDNGLLPEKTKEEENEVKDEDCFQGTREEPKKKPKKKKKRKRGRKKEKSRGLRRSSA